MAKLELAGLEIDLRDRLPAACFDDVAIALDRRLRRLDVGRRQRRKGRLRVALPVLYELPVGHDGIGAAAHRPELDLPKSVVLGVDRSCAEREPNHAEQGSAGRPLPLVETTASLPERCHHDAPANPPALFEIDQDADPSACPESDLTTTVRRSCADTRYWRSSSLNECAVRAAPEVSERRTPCDIQPQLKSRNRACGQGARGPGARPPQDEKGRGVAAASSKPWARARPELPRSLEAIADVVRPVTLEPG